MIFRTVKGKYRMALDPTTDLRYPFPRHRDRRRHTISLHHHTRRIYYDIMLFSN